MIHDAYGPNDEKETLCCLAVGFKQQNETYELVSWEAGFCYSDKITRKISCISSIERYCLKALTQELLYCKAQEIPVVTYRTMDIPALRLRFLYHRIPISLRGIRYICLQQIFQDHFLLQRRNHNYASVAEMAETMNINTTDATLTEIIYELYTRALPLLPTGVI